MAMGTQAYLSESVVQQQQQQQQQQALANPYYAGACASSCSSFDFDGCSSTSTHLLGSSPTPNGNASTGFVFSSDISCSSPSPNQNDDVWNSFEYFWTTSSPKAQQSAVYDGLLPQHTHLQTQTQTRAPIPPQAAIDGNAMLMLERSNQNGNHDGGPPVVGDAKMEYSSDEIDYLDDDEKSSKSSSVMTMMGGRSPESKTLISERRRRGRLNERLYALRSLVPKITKMDKASIVGDAICYVQDLQKQVKDIQTEIQGLQNNLNNASQTPPVPSAERERDLDSVVSEVDNDGGGDGRSPSGLPSNDSLFSPAPIQVDVSKVDEKTYHVRMHCKKAAGVLIRLMRALEAIHLDFHNANLTTFDGHIINTATVKIKRMSVGGAPTPMEADSLRGTMLETLSRHGFMAVNSNVNVNARSSPNSS